MSRYGSVTISGPAALVTRIVQSADADDLTALTNAAIAALPAGYVVVGITLAGAGDGATFTVTIEAGATADVVGGFTGMPSVACFMASEAEALLLARLQAGPTGGAFADTQVVGASKGTRFMGMVVKGTLASGGTTLVAGQDAIDQADDINPTTSLSPSGTPTFLPRNVAGDPLEVVFPAWASGDILQVRWQLGVQIGTAINALAVWPMVSLDGGSTWLNAYGLASRLDGQSFDALYPSVGPAEFMILGGGAVAVASSGTVRVRLGAVGANSNDGTGVDVSLGGLIVHGASSLVCERWPATSFVQPPVNGLTP